MPVSFPASLDAFKCEGCPLLPQGLTVPQLRRLLEISLWNKVRRVQRTYRLRMDRRNMHRVATMTACIRKQLGIHLPRDLYKVLFRMLPRVTK
jgi:hypothetical protein